MFRAVSLGLFCLFYLSMIFVIWPLLGVTIKLFADDTKLYYVFNNAMSPDCLQSCLLAISAWSDHWQLKLAPLKCSVMHVNSTNNRDTNQNYSYCIGQVIVPSSTSCFTDLGVSYDDKLGFKPHIDQTVAKASLRAKFILKCFQSRDPQTIDNSFLCFCKTHIRVCQCHLESHYKNQISKIEGVYSAFFCKRLQGLWSHPYCSRLAQLGLDSLWCRRVKADLLVCYKILHKKSS